MTEWYSKAVPGDGSEHLRLSRILDIAQDLKALSVMLAAVGKGTFVIDLAILASRYYMVTESKVSLSLL